MRFYLIILRENHLMRADEIDCDLMEISAHFGARPSHAEWQGEIVSRSGKSGYLSLNDIGYGQADGFMGVNCRHNWYMYFEGNSRIYSCEELDEYKNHTVVYNDRVLSDYEASQKQRTMERAVREKKRALVGINTAIAETDDEKLKEELKKDFERQSVKLKQREQKLADFCGQTQRRADNFRTQVYGFDRSTSGRAVWANKRVAMGGNSGIIKVDKITLEYKPNSITEKVNKNGGVDRNYYGIDGKQIKQISNNNHGNSKNHLYGNNGEHAHDYIYDDKGNLVDRPIRELTEKERQENGDIL